MPWIPGTPYRPDDFVYDNWSQKLAPAFSQALMSLQNRGLDVSAPDQVLDLAYPRVGSSAQLRQGHEQELMRALQMFRAGQSPEQPGLITPPPTWQDSDIAGSADSTVGNPTAANQVTGFSPQLALQGAALGLSPAPGIPGAIGTIAGLATSSLPGFPNVNPLSLAGVNPNGNLTLQTDQGPLSAVLNQGSIQAAARAALAGNPTLTSSLDPSLAAAIQANPSLMSDPQFMSAVLGKDSPLQGQTIGSALFGFNSDISMPPASPHPAFGFAGFNPPGPEPNPQGGFNVFGDPNPNPTMTGLEGGKTAEGGKTFSDTNLALDVAAGTSSPGGPAGPGAPGDAGVAGGAAPGGSSGGTSTSGSGDAYKKGGVVKDTHKGFARRKGSEVVPIKAHEGEFVVNKNASDAARPELEALNRLIPDGSGKRQSLADAVSAASKFFDVA